MAEWLFDGLLALGLLWMGWRTAVSPDLFRGIMAFIIFGLFMVLCWARLEAPDVALAEAAIGTGITGALLLDAYRVLGAGEGEARSPAVAAPGRLVLALLSLLLAGGLAWVLLIPASPAIDLGEMARVRLPDSGVSHPLTAVLLNFRGYDTLLEVLVLVLALLGMATISRGAAALAEARLHPAHDSALVATLIRLLAPLTVLVAGYLLWAGAHAPGGAFQAGAVLAAMGILLRLSERLQPVETAPLGLRALVVLGLAVFSAVALGVMAAGGRLLEYPPAWAGALILAIEGALTLSIATILVLLFSAAPGLTRNRS
ncbi:MAG: DUF4040 domain-containing protein [Pseudomonadota bacterium]|nr:DUF4040 domain-containing protein [Pseudomonadota bacterium]